MGQPLATSIQQNSEYFILLFLGESQSGEVRRRNIPRARAPRKTAELATRHGSGASAAIGRRQDFGCAHTQRGLIPAAA
jgi:hypothetical protein